MRAWMAVIGVLALLCSVAGAATQTTETLKGSSGELKITRLGHASVKFDFNGKVIYADPFGKFGDYAKLPKADLILITHEHFDHLDMEAISKIKTDKTVIVSSAAAAEKNKGFKVMKNGDTITELGFKIEAVPAYNVVHKRDNGQPFHPKGHGNGYVINFGDLRVYVAGDTENIPEMKDLKGITAAFLPANLPYTMTGQMVADAAKAIKPKYLFPYHYDMGDSQLGKVVNLMKDVPGIEIRGIGK
ncbi:MAG: MBL fold metallo-hydrolase [Thermodesulfobacteriota bacterium]